MKMKIAKMAILTFIVTLTIIANCQNVAKEGKIVKPLLPVTEYNRSAVTMILLSYPNESHSREIQTEFPKIKVPEKFDDNTLSTQMFTRNINRNEHKAGLTSDVLLAMNTNKIGNGIIAKWYNRQADGSFNMDLIGQRGLYNATDMDVVNASAKKIGQAALKDSGEKLLANSYVLVMDYSGVQTTEEAYNASNTASDKRVKHGWTGNFIGYLYKLNFNDSISSIFYNDLWVNKEDDSSIKTARSAKFQDTSFPMSYVTTVSGSISAEQPNPGSTFALFVVQESSAQLFNDLLNKGVEQAEYQIAKNYEAFQVKTPVYSIDPIAAKIGKKEGVKLDYRYFIFENKLKNNGNTKAVRKAVVRASSKIIDNRTIASGNSTAVTTFYQIGGKRVDEGMLLKQKNDKGIGIFVINSFGEIGGYTIGGEYLTRIAKSFKIIGELGFETKMYGSSYSWNGGGDVSFMRFNIGISKSIYFARNFQLEPSLSVGKEMTSDIAGTDSEGNADAGGSYYFKPGLKFGANIFYNLQLIAGINYYTFFGGITNMKGEKISGFENDSWTDLYPNREGISMDLGLRLQF